MIPLPAPVIVRNRLGCHSCKGNLRTDRGEDGPVLVCIMCGRRHQYQERPKHQEAAVMPVKRGKCENCGRDGVVIAAKGLCRGLCYHAQMGKDGEDRDKALLMCREKVEKMNLGQHVRGAWGRQEGTAVPPLVPVKQEPPPAAPVRPVELHFHVSLTAEFMNVIEKALREARA